MLNINILINVCVILVMIFMVLGVFIVNIGFLWYIIIVGVMLFSGCLYGVILLILLFIILKLFIVVFNNIL